MGKTLCRYVYRELATPFFFALLIFTIILFTVRILKLVELVVNRGVPLEQLLAIFLYILPSFFEVTVPMSFLLALLWSFGRLSSDREILALKSCGVSFLQIAFPVAVATLLVLGGTFFLTLYARPWSNTALRQVIYEVTKTRATAGLKEKTFNDEFDGIVVYTDEIQPPGDVLGGVMIADNRTAQGKIRSSPARDASSSTRTASYLRSGFSTERFIVPRRSVRGIKRHTFPPMI